MKEALNDARSPPTSAASPINLNEVFDDITSLESYTIFLKRPESAHKTRENWLEGEENIFEDIENLLWKLQNGGQRVAVDSEKVLNGLHQFVNEIPLKQRQPQEIHSWLEKGKNALAQLLAESKELKEEFRDEKNKRGIEARIVKRLVKRVEQKQDEQGQKLEGLKGEVGGLTKRVEGAEKEAKKAIELRDALSSGLDCIRGVINRILKFLKVKTESIEKIINKLGRSFSNLKDLKEAVNASLARIGIRIKTFKVNKEQLIALLKDERFRGLVAAVINVYEIGKRHMVSLEGIRKEDGKYIITIGQTNVPKKDERAGAIEMEIDKFFSKYSKEGEIVLVAFIVEDARKLKAVVSDPEAVEGIKRRSNALEEYIKENGIRETTKGEDESEEDGVIEGVQGGQGGGTADGGGGTAGQGSGGTQGGDGGTTADAGAGPGGVGPTQVAHQMGVVAQVPQAH